jgi:hypothetical protein
VSAGTFLVACMRKSADELRKANIESAARQHQIPVEWAREYRKRELEHKESGR